jgi:peptide/nickel transport system permease protein
VAGLLLLLLALSPRQFAPARPDEQDPSVALARPGRGHLFGTDNFGRDVFSRVIYGARTSLVIGAGAAVLGLALAPPVALVAAALGGWLDETVQRLVDALMALPWLVIVLSVMTLIGPGEKNTLLVIGCLSAPVQQRVLRGAALRVVHLPYVDAARALGCSTPRILWRYLLPNIAGEVLVLLSLGVGNAILTEASLSFLGVGVVPPAPAWGYMLGVEGRRFLTTAPWLAIFPGAAIALAVFSANVLGDTVRDIIDPAG